MFSVGLLFSVVDVMNVTNVTNVTDVTRNDRSPIMFGDGFKGGGSWLSKVEVRHISARGVSLETFVYRVSFVV